MWPLEKVAVFKANRKSSERRDKKEQYRIQLGHKGAEKINWEFEVG